MSNIIDSIKLSGTVYTLSAQTSGGNPTVELTQAQYDALVTAGTVQADTYYIITDAQAGDLTNYYTKTETNTLLGGKADTATTYTKTEVDNAITAATATKQDTLVSGTNIKTINNTSILGSGNIDIQGGGGGGKAVSGGTNISITTGETADTINCTLPISGDSKGIYNTPSYPFVGSGTKYRNVVFGNNNTINRNGSSTSSCYNLVFGEDNSLGDGEYTGNLNSNLVGGRSNKVYGSVSHAIVLGYSNELRNAREFASGFFNVSNTGSTNADKTVFSVGNGTSTSERHNAFEIRQNGDIYLTKDGQDVKLQDQLGGGGDVTTNTDQNITGTKTFVGEKKIKLKQSSNSDKIGFTLLNSASTNNEVASFEFRPNTFTIDNVQHPLLYFGHYRNTNVANAGVPQTVIGYRQYDQLNAAAYHYLLPLPEKAKTPFSLTTSFKDYYAPMGFKNGSTMITADNTGVVDLSSELGGLKLKKLTQAEYDALATKDNSTLYVIVN